MAIQEITSAIDQIDVSARKMLSEILAWRLWAARKVCDCEAHTQIGLQMELTEIDRHRDGCRYKIVATDLGDSQ